MNSSKKIEENRHVSNYI